MTTKLEVMTYVTKPIIAGGMMYFYSIFIDNKNIGDQSAWYDASLFALSLFTSKLANDLLQNNVDLQLFSVVGMAFEPIITGFVYTYLYDNVFATTFKQRSNRNFNTNFMLAAVANIVTSFVHNPLLGFFTGTRIF